MRSDKAIKTAFLISLMGHCLFLGIPEKNMVLPQDKRPKDMVVRIEIEKHLLLPKIDVMGKKKKLKAEDRKQKTGKRKKEKGLFKETAAEETEPQPKEGEVVEKPEPKEQIKKVVLEKKVIKKSEQKPIKEYVKVTNPQKEAMLRYQDMVKQRIESCRRYPNWAKKQGIEGTVYIAFTVLSNGSNRDVKIVRSSGSMILDEEAIATIKRANPFPPIPKEISNSFVRMDVSIVFTLK